jgi:trigger factor
MEEIKVEDQSSIGRKISIFVPTADTVELFDNYYKELGSKVVLKGFRKGTAPRYVLESQYGKHAKSEVSQELFQRTYQKALTDNNISPVSMPVLSDIDNDTKTIGKFDADGFKVEVYVEVMPKVDAIGYQNMELDFPAPPDATKLVQAKVEELQVKYAERRQVERPAQNGDQVVVDFIGIIDGRPVKELTENGFTIDKLGAGQTIPGFDEQIVGLKLNDEKEFSLTLPDNVGGGFGGKTVPFSLVVQNVIEVKPEPVTDELAIMAGYNTLPELMAALETEAKTMADKVNRESLELQIVGKLAKLNNVELPESVVQQERNRILKELQNKGTQITQSIADNIEAASRYNLARYVLADAIFDKEPGLEIMPDDLDAALEKASKANGKEKSEFVSMLYNAKMMDPFINQLKTERVLNFIIAQAKPKQEIPVTVSDVVTVDEVAPETQVEGSVQTTNEVKE